MRHIEWGSLHQTTAFERELTGLFASYGAFDHLLHQMSPPAPQMTPGINALDPCPPLSIWLCASQRILGCARFPRIKGTGTGRWALHKWVRDVWLGSKHSSFHGYVNGTRTQQTVSELAGSWRRAPTTLRLAKCSELATWAHLWSYSLVQTGVQNGMQIESRPHVLAATQCSLRNQVTNQAPFAQP